MSFYKKIVFCALTALLCVSAPVFASGEDSVDSQTAGYEDFYTSAEYAAECSLVQWHPSGISAEDMNGLNRAADEVADTAQNHWSDRQYAIVMRARQMAEVEWTPLADRYGWGGDNPNYPSSSYPIVATDGTSSDCYFLEGKTYRGVPYSQAVGTGFVGWDISIDDFVRAVNDSSSKFYSGYSTYARTAPYYGTDCASFVSYAWQTSSRYTCATFYSSSVCYYVGEELSMLELGDCLLQPEHVRLVTDIGYDAEGNIISVELTEETPRKMKVTCYGALIPGKTYEYTSSDVNNIFYGGYQIYRLKENRSVTYTPCDSVPLDDSVQYVPAPKISVSSSELFLKTITLSSAYSSVIYYTLDGTAPSASNGTVYTGPFSVSSDTVIRAKCEPGSGYAGSFELKYKVTGFITDVPSDAWYYTAVQYVYEAGYFNGTSSTTFSPNEDMTRGMFITVLGRMAGVYSGFASWSEGWRAGQMLTSSIYIRSGPGTSYGAVGVVNKSYSYVIVMDEAYDSGDNLWYKINYYGTIGYVCSKNINGSNPDKQLIRVYDGAFTDLGNTYYTGYAMWAYMAGVMYGTSETTFSPENSITRQDAACLVYRYLVAYKGKTVTPSYDSLFLDHAEVSEYALEALYGMKGIGILVGSDGYYYPQNNISRAEVAAVVQRVAQWSA